MTRSGDEVKKPMERHERGPSRWWVITSVALLIWRTALMVVSWHSH